MLPSSFRRPNTKSNCHQIEAWKNASSTKKKFTYSIHDEFDYISTWEKCSQDFTPRTNTNTNTFIRYSNNRQANSYIRMPIDYTIHVSNGIITRSTLTIRSMFRTTPFEPLEPCDPRFFRMILFEQLTPFELCFGSDNSIETNIRPKLLVEYWSTTSTRRRPNISTKSSRRCW